MSTCAKSGFNDISLAVNQTQLGVANDCIQPQFAVERQQRQKRFFPILITMLSLVLIFGAIIPRLKVPAPSRAELEKFQRNWQR